MNSFEQVRGVRERETTSILKEVFVEVGGLRTHVECAGTGSPLLLLHGWGGSIRSFGPVLPAMADAYNVCCVDFPGFGLSQLPNTSWGVDDYVTFVLGVMQRLGTTRTHLLGHSHGGRVALALAARAPELVDRLVLVDAAGIRSPRTARLRMRGLTARTARRILAHPIAGSTGRRALASIYARLGMSDYANAGPLRSSFVRIVNENLSQLLPAVRAPTLVVWGSRDTETPLWMGEQMAKAIPNAELLVLDGAGHHSYLDEREQFEKRVLSFLGGEAT